MSRPQFTEQAWNEYLDWHVQDKKTLKKINRLVYKVLNEDVVEIYSCKGHYEDH